MNRTIAILLILIFLLEYAGSFILFQNMQFNHYDDMKKELRRNKNYIIIKLSIKDFLKYKIPNKDEVRIDKRMYDYDNPKIENDSITLYSVRDYKEEFMLSSFFKKLNKQTDRNTRENSAMYLITFLHLVYKPTDPIKAIADLYITEIKPQKRQKRPSLCKGFLCKILIPPEKIIDML